MSLNPGGSKHPAASEATEDKATSTPETREVDSSSRQLQEESLPGPAQGKESEEEKNLSRYVTSVLGSSVRVVVIVLTVLAILGSQVVSFL